MFYMLFFFQIRTEKCDCISIITTVNSWLSNELGGVANTDNGFLWKTLKIECYDPKDISELK